MIVSLSLVAVALAILILLLYLDGGHRSSIAGLDDLAGQTQPVDIDAFRNLIDPDEDEFLRTNLSPGQFRVIQRERIQSALDYIRRSTHNAACLLRLGETAARSTDPRIAQAGRQLIESALQLRANALLSTVKLRARMALPGARFSYGKLADNYQHLSGLAGQLALMQHPTHASRLSALL
jgi:hypothetical protein